MAVSVDIIEAIQSFLAVKLITRIGQITADDVKRAVCHERINVQEGSIGGLASFLKESAKDSTLFVEDVDEIVQDFEVECRREDASSYPPLVTFAHQEPLLQPSMVPIVIHSFVKDLLALQNSLIKIKEN